MIYHIITLGNRPESYNAIVENAGEPPVSGIDTCYGKECDELSRYMRGPDIVETKPDIWKPKYGELGIWHSQMNAWTWLLDSNAPYLIVLEDDVITQPGWLENTTEVIERLPDNWDMISLAYSPSEIPNIRRKPTVTGDNGTNITWRARSSRRFDKTERNGLYVDDFQTWQGVAWAISWNGALNLMRLANAEGIVLPVDLWMHYRAHAGHFKAYAVDPNRIVVSADLMATTNIHDTEVYDG